MNTTPAASERRRDALILGLFLLAYVLTRVAWVLLEPNTTLYWEEDHRWASAEELLRGAGRPLLDYQADHYQGGSLVLVAMVAAVFGAFGQSLLGLKLVAISFGAATLAALFVLGRMEFGRRVGVLAAAALLTGPPLLAFSGLVGMGSHGESALFSLIQILLFLPLLSSRRRTRVMWAAFGFVSGLGVWFCYTTGLSLAACGITWLVLEKAPRRKELLAAAAGACVGLVPWFIYNVHYDFVGLERLLELFGGGDPIDPWLPHDRWYKLWSFFRRDLALGLVSPFWFSAGRPPSPMLVGAVVLPLAAGIGAALLRAIRLVAAAPWRGERPPLASSGERDRAELVFVVHALLFLAAYVGSSFVLEPDKGAHTYRLFLPLVILWLVPAARSAAISYGKPGSKRLLSAAACVLFLAGSTLSTWQTATRETIESYGHDREQHLLRGNIVRGVLSHRKYERDLARAWAEASLIGDPRYRYRFLQGIGWGILFRFETSGPKPELLEEIDALPVSQRAPVLSGMRFAAGSSRAARLEQREREGRATALDREQLRRVRELRALVQERWEPIPARYRDSDEVLD